MTASTEDDGGSGSGGSAAVRIRPARPADVRGINRLVEPMTHTGILLGKDLVSYYEAVQEFLSRPTRRARSSAAAPCT